MSGEQKQSDAAAFPQAAPTHHWWYDPFTVERDLARLIALCMVLTAVLLMQLDALSGMPTSGPTPASAAAPYASR